MKRNKHSRIIGMIVVITALAFLLTSYQSKLYRSKITVTEAIIKQLSANANSYQQDSFYLYKHGKLYVSFQYVIVDPNSEIIHKDLKRINQEFLTNELTECSLVSNQITYNFEDVTLKLTNEHVSFVSKDFEKQFKRASDHSLRLVDDAKIEYQLILETSQ